MNFLIAYTSVTGTASECVELLKSHLSSHNVTVARLEDGVPALSGFDACVIGAPIRYGKPHKAMKKFISERKDELLASKCVYFVCCAYADRVDEYFEDMLDRDLKRSAFMTVNFGGTLDVSRQKGFFMKRLVKMLRNDIEENGENDDESMSRILPTINTTEISKTADIITGRVQK